MPITEFGPTPQPVLPELLNALLRPVYRQAPANDGEIKPPTIDELPDVKDAIDGIETLIQDAFTVFTARQDADTAIPPLPANATLLCSVSLTEGAWEVSASVRFVGTLAAVSSLMLIAFVGIPTTTAIGADASTFQIEMHPAGAFIHSLGIPGLPIIIPPDGGSVGVYAIANDAVGAGLTGKARMLARRIL